MRTLELWIDLYAHSLPDAVEAWPVWGQWRCVQDGRVHWQVSGFVLDDREPIGLVTVARLRELLARDDAADRMGQIIFPKRLRVGSINPDQAQPGITPNVHEWVAKTTAELAVAERLAIGLTLDPTLTGGADIFAAQQLRVPALERAGSSQTRIAEREEICIVQVQQIRERRPKPLIPGWQLVRILEIAPPTPSGSPAWSDELREQAPMTEIRTCTDDAESVNEMLLDFRPHVIVNHSPTALQHGAVSSAYLVATQLVHTPGGEAPYRALCRLLGAGASGVLVLRDMNRSRSALQLIEILCQRGTLADALLELHTSDDSDSRDVTVCGRDLRLRLRAEGGGTGPATAIGEDHRARPAAKGVAFAWIPLGDRLRGTMDAGTPDEQQIRVVALSAHIVKVTATIRVTSDDGDGVLRTGGLSDALARRVRTRCRQRAAELNYEVTGSIVAEVLGSDTKLLGADFEGLDATEAVFQASEAALRRALLGEVTETAGYLIIPSDLMEDDTLPLPSASPVLAAEPGSPTYEAVGSVPWEPNPDRVWRGWDVWGDGSLGGPFEIAPLQWSAKGAFWSAPHRFVHPRTAEGNLAEMLEWHLSVIRRTFPIKQFPQAQEFASSGPVLVSGNRLMFPSTGGAARLHTTSVREGPSTDPDGRG